MTAIQHCLTYCALTWYSFSSWNSHPISPLLNNFLFPYVTIAAFTGGVLVVGGKSNLSVRILYLKGKRTILQHVCKVPLDNMHKKLYKIQPYILPNKSWVYVCVHGWKFLFPLKGKFAPNTSHLFLPFSYSQPACVKSRKLVKCVSSFQQFIVHMLKWSTISFQVMMCIFCFAKQWCHTKI